MTLAHDLDEVEDREKTATKAREYGVVIVHAHIDVPRLLRLLRAAGKVADSVIGAERHRVDGPQYCKICAVLTEWTAALREEGLE